MCRVEAIKFRCFLESIQNKNLCTSLITETEIRSCWPFLLIHDGCYFVLMWEQRRENISEDTQRKTNNKRFNHTRLFNISSLHHSRNSRTWARISQYIMPPARNWVSKYSTTKRKTIFFRCRLNCRIKKKTLSVRPIVISFF